MTWYELYKKIGKQTLHNMKNNKAYAVIDDKIIYIDIKYDVRGLPYLVQEEVKTK